MDEGSAALLRELKDMLESCELDLIRYQHHGGDPVLEANYKHKQAQVESIRAQIKELEKGGGALGNC